MLFTTQIGTGRAERLVPSELDSKALFLMRRDVVVSIFGWLELARPRDKSPRSVICCVSRATFIARRESEYILLVLEEVGIGAPLRHRKEGSLQTATTATTLRVTH